MTTCIYRTIVGNPLYQTIQVVHFVSAIVTLILMAIFLYRFNFRLYLHRNIQMLLVFIFASTIVHSIFMGAFLALNIYKFFYINDENCENLLIDGTVCIFLRIPYYLCITALVMGQFGIAIERICNIVLGVKYQQDNGKIGFGIILLIIVIVLLLYYPYLIKEKIYDQFNCALIDQESTDLLIGVYEKLLAFDLLNCLLFLGVFLYNLHKKKSARYHVQARFQVEETSVVVTLLSPLIVGHTVLFSIYIASFLTINFLNLDRPTANNWIMILYLVPYYTLLVPTSLMWNLKKIRSNRCGKVQKLVSQPQKGKEGVDSHFQTLYEQWK